MVCQAASQTRFRAFKHESGIAGRTTIIVRVIACFQPLQNCQNIQKCSFSRTYNHYSGCSIGWMGTAKEIQMSRHLSALKSPDFNQMMPHLNSSTLTVDNAFQGKPNSNLRVDDFFKLPHSYWSIPYSVECPCLKNSQVTPPHGLRASDKPVDTFCAPQEKKFIIFDRSENHTRLFFGPFSPQNQVIVSKIPPSTQKVESYPIVEEKWDENDLNDEEDEMRENTQEIDALLYSDSDDEDNNEVTSTRHIPFEIEEDSSPKRQRLLGGMYTKSSFARYESPVKRADSSCDRKSSYVAYRTSSYDGVDSSNRDKKVKIHETLKILDTIIPGSKNNKDPVSIIEEAIIYLESLRKEAEAFGLTEPESKFVTYT